MDLPRKWPGRVKVRQALTLMRLLGKWHPYLDQYTKASRSAQKRTYHVVREIFYWELHGIHHDDPRTKRIGR